MVLIHDTIIKIDIYNFEMSYKTPEKSLKSNQIYSAVITDMMAARSWTLAYLAIYYLPQKCGLEAYPAFGPAKVWTSRVENDNAMT